MPSSFCSRVKSSDFQKCSEIIAPLVSGGDFDAAFEIMREFRIGPNTKNSSDQNFLWTFIEALYSHDLSGAKRNGVGANRDARDNYLAKVRLIIDQGVDLNHQDKYGSTVLSYASEITTLDFCKLILEDEGVEIDLFDSTGATALDLVITDFYNLNYGPSFEKRVIGLKTELFRLLLLNGADPYRPYFNESTMPPTKYSKLDPYGWLKDEDGQFFYKKPAYYVIEQSLEYAEYFAPEYKGREEEEPLRKIFFDTLKELGKA